jgi:hypothetical protein
MIRSIPIQDLRANSQARFTPPRPWAPLTEAEWALVATQLDIVRMAGRRVADPRARVNAIFMVAARGLPWRRVPEAVLPIISRGTNGVLLSASETR